MDALGAKSKIRYCISLRSKRRRSIDPEQPRFRAAGIAPAMRRGAFEIEAVAGLQAIVFALPQPDFKRATQDVEKFLAFVRVGFAAAPAGLDAEKMRLHGGVAPSQEFHAHASVGFQNFSLLGTHQAGVFSGGFEERKNIGAIETRDAPKSSDRRAHLAAFERAEKTDGDSSSASHLREGKSAARAQAAKALAGKRGGFSRESDGALPLQHVHNGGGVEAAGAAQKQRALQQPHIGFGIQAIAALGALRSNQAELFPGAQGGGRNLHATRDFADAQQGARFAIRRCFG